MSASEPTILIVEDEVNLADLFTEWLSSKGEIRTAYSGREALELFDSSVDVVLLDRNLPDINGDDVLLTLRAGSETPVAFVSGVDPTVKILQLPVDAYCRKPVSRETLIDTVATLRDRADMDAISRRTSAGVAKLEVLSPSLDIEPSDLEEIIPELEAVSSPTELTSVLALDD